ncbi:MAG TPA: helix-hairpin-helix domain-containing protein [Bacteroidales bacterium]|nr:helix-hairpin-helix domain-containing protein [Bacteroidales bacterium]
MKRLVLFLWIITFCPFCPAQEEKEPSVINAIAEQLAGEGDDAGLEENFADMLRSLAEDRVKINSADENEVSRLFFLTAFQSKIICDYVRKNGRIVSFYEISNIPGFDPELVKMMIPFISLEDVHAPRRDSLTVHQSLLTNLSLKTGSVSTAGPGSAVKLLTRYRLSAGNISAGFTAEKDPGEKFLQGRPPLPDFLSAHISVRGNGFIKSVVAGDFSARFGLGIALNADNFSTYSLTLPGNLSGRTGIRAYTSTDETSFFRGIALTSGWKKNEISVFLSANRIDGTLTDSSGDGRISVTGIDRTGLHNSLSSIKKKDNLSEYAAGIILTRSFKRFNTGLLAFYNGFSIPFSVVNDSPAGLFGFSGSRNILVSGWYSVQAGRFILSGEVCSDQRSRTGVAQTVAFRASDRLSLNIVLGRSSPGFTTFHGRAPVTGSGGGNESVIAAGVNFEVARYLFLGAGAYIRIYNWLHYRCSAPSVSARKELRLRYVPGDKLNAEFYFTFRSAEVDNRMTTGTAYPCDELSRSMRLSVRYSLTDKITLSPRFDWRYLSPSRENGISIIQDINFRVPAIRSSFWIRYGIYSTCTFSSAIYAWENDLLYSFSVPALYGRGSRFYLLWSFAPGRKAELRIKYGVTTSGGAAGNSNVSSDFRLQLSLKM